MDILWLRPDKPANLSVGRHRIAEILRERGHEVDVWNTTLVDSIDVLNEVVDVVVGTTRLGALVGAWRKLLRRTPLVIDHIDPIVQFRRNHSATATWGVSQIEKFTFRLADHVMVVYEEELPRVRRQTDAVTKTHLGVDFERFAHPTAESIQQARERLAIPSACDRKRVIYIGSLEPAYRVPMIVDAMTLLPEWELTVLGDGSQRRLLEGDIPDNVRYLGTVPHAHIPGFLHESDVGISLVDDRHTLKLLEYGANGLPAVTVRGDAENRFEGLVEFCDVEPASIAAAIRRADREATVDSFQEFTRQFDWYSVVDQYEEVLTEVTNG